MSSSHGLKEKKASDEAVAEQEPQIPSAPCSPSIHETLSHRNEDEARSVYSQLPPPPDGGLHAWMKVFGGFMVYINIWGFTISFGAFQAYYRGTILSDSSSSSISWIGTTQAFLLILVGSLSGPLFDLGYFRSMLYTGNVLIVFGLMMLSLCDQYWQIFLAQGLCMGLGAGLLYVPSLALVSIWFDRKRALAMGIVMSGIAVGGIVYIMTFDRLVPSIGFPWTIRVIGFIALSVSLVSFPALLSGSSMLAQRRKARALFDRTALKDRLFIIFTCSTFLNFLGYNVPYFLIPTFAKEKLGSTDSTAFLMLTLSVSASFFGRLVSGIAAHYFGSIVTWMICSFLGSIMAFSWISIETERTLIAFSIVWGFLSASLVTLPSAAFASICPDLSRLGTRLGMSWGITSIASLIGVPIAGALLKSKEGYTDFLGAQVWSGTCLFLTTIALIILWLSGRKTLDKGWRI